MSFRAFIQHNFWLKLFSLVLATVIWVLIKYGVQDQFTMGQSPVINPMGPDSMSLPVYILKQPGDARIFKVTPDRVVVTVTGESAILRNLTKKDFNAYVDMTLIRPNEPLSQKVQLDVPKGVTELSIVPLAVNVEQISP